MTDPTTAAATAAADIKDHAQALIAKIDDSHAAGEFSTLLANAKSAVVSAIQYVEAHCKALEAKIEGDTKGPAPVAQASATTPVAPAAAPEAAPAAEAPAAAPASTDAPAAAPAAAPSTASV